MQMTSEEAVELRRLYEELPAAVARADTALRTRPPNYRSEGEALKRFLAEDDKVGSIVRRIKAIRRRPGNS